MRIQSGERAIKYEEKIRLRKGKTIQKEYLKLRKEQILIAYRIIFPYPQLGRDSLHCCVSKVGRDRLVWLNV